MALSCYFTPKKISVKWYFIEIIESVLHIFTIFISAYCYQTHGRGYLV